MKRIQSIAAIAIVIILTMSATLALIGTGGIQKTGSDLSDTANKNANSDLLSVSGSYSYSSYRPSAPSLTAVSAGNAQLALSWSAPSSNGGSSISAYKVYRGTASGGETLLTTLGNVLTYTNTGLTNGQTYYYKVSAINTAGYSGSRSNELSNKPVAATATAPSVPQSLTATAGNAQLALSWSAPSSNGGSSISAYKVYRGTASGGETLLTTLGNVLTYTNTGLTNGQTYYYKVSATNSVGEGSQSSEAKAAPVSQQTSTPDAKILVYVSGSTYYAKVVATGAVITSGSDAKTVIQAALAKLTSGRTTQEKVQLQGNFNLNGIISLSSYTILALDGTVTATASIDNMISSSGTQYVEVSGGVWNYNGLGGSNPSAFMFYNCKNVNIHDCTVKTGAITVEIADHVTIVNNSVSGCAASGINAFLTCSYITISRNTVSDNNAGIYLYCQRDDGRADTIKNCFVSNNTVVRTVRDGISLYPEGAEDTLTNILVDNNVLIDAATDGDHMALAVGSGGGLDPTLVGSVVQCTIIKNMVSETGNYQCGGGTTVRGDYNTVKGNSFTNCYHTAMIIQNGDHNTLDSNSISTVRSAMGIEICDASSNIVSNNRITKTTSYGVWILGAQFSSDYSKANDIRANYISGAGDACVKIVEAGDSGNIIESNTLVGGTSIINNGSGSTVTNNTIQ